MIIYNNKLPPRSELVKIIKWVSFHGLKRIYVNEIARDFNIHILHHKLKQLLDHDDVIYDCNCSDDEEYYESNELIFDLLKVVCHRIDMFTSTPPWEQMSPWVYLDDELLDEFFREIREDFDYIGKLEDYIWTNHFITKDQERKEIDAKGIIYRACIKAYWNPHCEMGKRMATNRYNKMLEIGSEDDDDDCLCNYGIGGCKSSKCEDK
tara:strand:- start:9 stop:632 length:624 start_codon:yes stop_codon:yes gene_type:complete